MTIATNRIRPMVLALVSCLFAGGLLGCSKKPVDPEAEIEALIAEVEAAFESGDLGALKETLADDYSDPRGNDKGGLVGLLQLQFLRKRAVHVLSQIDDITVEADGKNARAIVMAAGGSTPIAGLEALADVRADIVRLQIRFTKPDDAWKVSSVIWKRASAGDFLGE